MTDVIDFPSMEAAVKWMEQEVDDPYISDIRFAYLDDPAGLAEFKQIADDGCCGSAEYEVSVKGRLAKAGCNYGH